MTTPGSRPPLPHRRRAWLLGVVVPVLITAAVWLAIILLVPRLPVSVALHSGPSGVDRVSSFRDLLTTSAVISGISLVAMAVLAVTTGRHATDRRIVLGLAVALATLLGGITLVQVLTQVDPRSAVDARSPATGILVTMLAALALGVLAGLLAGEDPRQPATTALPADAARMPLAPTEHATWVQSVTSTHPTIALLLSVLVVVPGIGLSLIARHALPAVITLLTLAVLAAFLRWQVRVDARGITARGTFGLPRVHVPTDEVMSASVVQVKPLAEFRGWGLRSNLDGTVAVTIRKGEVIAVDRTGGRRTVITVDDAATGAALLNTYAERARSTSNP